MRRVRHRGDVGTTSSPTARSSCNSCASSASSRGAFHDRLSSTSVVATTPSRSSRRLLPPWRTRIRRRPSLTGSGPAEGKGRGSWQQDPVAESGGGRSPCHGGRQAPPVTINLSPCAVFTLGEKRNNGFPSTSSPFSPPPGRPAGPRFPLLW
jgi:hypothetical protein